QLQVFLISRPEIPARYRFSQILDEEYYNFVFYNILPSIVNYDIAIFLEYNLKLIKSERFLNAG
ncbi:hypothetical protein DL98DRAFT_439676, partial [Cadophora sp. DSE1049]